MKLRLFFVLAILILSLAMSACGNGEDTTLPDTPDTFDTEPTVTEPVETDLPETEPPHVHEYMLGNTVAGTCVEEGYEVYSCSCGLSYKNVIPSAHKYTDVKDTTGKYTKKLCSLCGDYKIVKNQTYVHNITFEGFNDIEKAVNAQKTLKFYAIASADGVKGGGEIKNNLDGSYAYIHDANFYIQDTSRTMVTKKFVVSADIKFEKTTDMELISFAYLNANGKWSYNSGVVKVTADGKLKLHGEENTLDVKFKEKGYTNITIVADPVTALCDVYVDEQLVKADIKYFNFPTDARECHIRYFDRKAGYAGSIDNIKMYEGDTPEFVVPDGLTFKK